MLIYEETSNEKRPCIAHVHALGCFAYTMMPNENRGKFDVEGIKYFAYCLLPMHQSI